ncbi:MAG: protein of unknown function [Nitrospira sp.]
MQALSNNQNLSDYNVHPHVEQAIMHALKGIRFGSVEIIVHDSKVVQIERKEKTRFDSHLSR